MKEINLFNEKIGNLELNFSDTLESILLKVCQTYKIDSRPLPFSDNYGTWVSWDEKTGHIEGKTDVSHHGSPIWETVFEKTLTKEENDALVAMCKLKEALDKLEGREQDGKR